MCLIALMHQTLPGHRLAVLANRDEFHGRLTRPCHWWDDAPILSGRDLEAGGTWLGVDRSGRLAAVTNFREWPPKSGRRSRGELPTGFLSGKETAPEAARRILDQGSNYGGFNLVLFDGEMLTWCSNRSTELRILPPGNYLVSNHLLDTPWPKAERLRTALADCESVDREGWLELLRDVRQAEDEHLPDTGFGLERERWLSSIFIVGEEYGTRSSTIVTLPNEGTARLTEVNHGRSGEENGRQDYSFELSGVDTHVATEALDPDPT